MCVGSWTSRSKILEVSKAFTRWYDGREIGRRGTQLGGWVNQTTGDMKNGINIPSGPQRLSRTTEQDERVSVRNNALINRRLFSREMTEGGNE